MENNKPEQIGMEEIFKMISKQIIEEKKLNPNPENNQSKRNSKKEKELSEYAELSISELLNHSKKDIFLAKEIFYSLIKDDRNSKAIEFLTRFIESNNNIITIKNDTKLEVWLYKKGIYVPNGICELKEQLRKILGSGFSFAYHSPIIERILVDTMTEQKEFIKRVQTKENSHLLPLENGILNLITKELLPFSPSLIFLNKLPLSYNPSAICPKIEQHFKDVLTTDDDSKVMFELIGFCLWKDYFIEKAFLFTGSGRNGKGKTIELIKNLVGFDNCCSVALSEFKEGEFAISELFGKMVNLAGDISSTALKDTGVFKMSVGRDVIGGNRKFLTKLNFVNYAKNIFACNELPRVYDNSVGFWERWIVLDFPYTFKEQKEYDEIIKGNNEDLKKKIKLMDTDHINQLTSKEELEGLLIKSIEGLDRLRKNKSFSYSIGSSEIKLNWTRKADSFLAFCQDNIESADVHAYMILKMNLRKYYHDYCMKNNVKGTSDKSIKITLEEYFGVSEYRTHDQETFWCGIKLKDNSIYKEVEDLWTGKTKVQSFKNL